MKCWQLSVLSAFAVVFLLLGAAACGDSDGDSTSSGVEPVCALNEDLEALNERTVDTVADRAADEPFPDAALLEENFVGSVSLLRQMAEKAPPEVEADLSDYAAAIARLSEMYAEFDYEQAEVWENADYDTYLRDYAVSDEVRNALGDWFVDNCGMDLQG